MLANELSLIFWIAGGVLVTLALIAVVVLIFTYTKISRLSRRVDDSFVSLAESLQARREAALQLAGAAQPELARALAAQSEAATPAAKAAGEQRIEQQLAKLRTLAAGRADELSALTAAGDRVQGSRRDYNSAARELNAKSRRFPGSIFSGTAGGRRELFEVDHAGAVAEVPRIRF